MSVPSYHVKSGDTVTFVTHNERDLHVHCEKGSNVLFDGRFGTLYMSGSVTVNSNLNAINLNIGGLPPGKNASGFQAIQTTNGQRINI